MTHLRNMISFTCVLGFGNQSHFEILVMKLAFFILVFSSFVVLLQGRATLMNRYGLGRVENGSQDLGEQILRLLKILEEDIEETYEKVLRFVGLDEN